MAAITEILYYNEDVALLPVSGNTPFGYYDDDPQFQIAGQKFAKFGARRLGYPIMEVELQDINFYAALEDAVTVYGKELYEYKIRENYLSMEGSSTGSILNTTLIQPNFATILRIAKDYGSEVGSGGNINYYSGSLQMIPGQQFYDLDFWASQSASLQPGDSIEIKRIFYEGTPAVNRFGDPYAGTGIGLQDLMQSFGFGNLSPAINFMLMPAYADVLRVQAIEFNDQIRKSAFTFELINNKLRIFPVPIYDDKKLWFTYIKQSERNSLVRNSSTSLVTNISNVPYDEINYSQINSPGRKWIFDYGLAVAKEILGNVRNKYGNTPYPGTEITVNGDALLNQAATDQEKLITSLRETLDSTSRQKQMEMKAQEASNMKDTLVNFPLPIIIG